MKFLETQSLLLASIYMVIGIVLLIRGGNWAVDSAVFIARRHGISPLIVGFTIVAFGTSLPELIVSVLANLQGSAGIAMGNVMGSNIANILMVIGVSSILVTLRTSSKAILKDLLMMLISTGILVFLLQYGAINRIAGLAMILMLVGYVLLQYRMAARGELPLEAEEDPEFSSPLVAYGLLLLGLVAIAIGAEFLVQGAKTTALALGVPEAVIALSIIACGTSLPELSTSVIAVRKGHTEITLGNIIGSNVFNILVILGFTALAKPISHGAFAPQLVSFDIWVVVAVTLIFTFLIMFTGKITRTAGIAFCLSYVVYNVYIYAIYMVGL